MAVEKGKNTCKQRVHLGSSISSLILIQNILAQSSMTHHSSPYIAAIASISSFWKRLMEGKKVKECTDPKNLSFPYCFIRYLYLTSPAWMKDPWMNDTKRSQQPVTMFYSLGTRHDCNDWHQPCYYITVLLTTTEPKYTCTPISCRDLQVKG